MNLLMAAPIPIREQLGRDLSCAAENFHAAVHAPFDGRYTQRVNAWSRTAFGLFLGRHASGLTDQFRVQILWDLDFAIEKICANLSSQPSAHQKKQTIDFLGPLLVRTELFQILYEKGAGAVGEVIEDIEKNRDPNSIFSWDTVTRQFLPDRQPS